MAQDRWVYRREWGAVPPKATTPIAPELIKFLVVHYSAMNADEQADHRNCASRVRGIQRYHMTSNQLTPGGASDIGYNWVFCKHGYVFQGRGIRNRAAATGAANSFTLAACFLGNDTTGRDDVTPEGRDALERILKLMKRSCPNLQGVKGHRDFMSTGCPGDELYAYTKFLNREHF